MRSDKWDEEEKTGGGGSGRDEGWRPKKDQHGTKSSERALKKQEGIANRFESDLMSVLGDITGVEWGRGYTIWDENREYEPRGSIKIQKSGITPLFHPTINSDEELWSLGIGQTPNTSSPKPAKYVSAKTVSTPGLWKRRHPTTGRESDLDLYSFATHIQMEQHSLLENRKPGSKAVLVNKDVIFGVMESNILTGGRYDRTDKLIRKGHADPEVEADIDKTFKELRKREERMETYQKRVLDEFWDMLPIKGYKTARAVKLQKKDSDGTNMGPDSAPTIWLETGDENTITQEKICYVCDKMTKPEEGFDYGILPICHKCQPGMSDRANVIIDSNNPYLAGGPHDLYGISGLQGRDMKVTDGHGE